MNREVIALQAEIGRLNRVVAQARQSMDAATAELQRLSLQGEQVEREKITSLAYLITLLLEHHQGEAGISVALHTEIAKGRTIYGTQCRLSADRQTYLLAATDDKGNVVEKPSFDVRQGAKAVEKQIEAEVVAEGEVTECPECHRKNGAHNLDCTGAVIQDGDGDGDGDGSGYGDGDGSGYGSGEDRSGYVYGDGDGSVDGFGYGYGDGDGSGDEDGSGDG